MLSILLLKLCLGTVSKALLLKSILVRSVLRARFPALTPSRIAYVLCERSVCEMVGSEAVLGGEGWDVWCYGLYTSFFSILEEVDKSNTSMQEVDSVGDMGYIVGTILASFLDVRIMCDSEAKNICEALMASASKYFRCKFEKLPLLVEMYFFVLSMASLTICIVNGGVMFVF